MEVSLTPRPILEPVLLPRTISEPELTVRPITPPEPHLIEPENQLVEISGQPLGDPQARIGQAILDPKMFAQIFLQSEIWDKQGQILDAVATKTRVAVKACHSSSKTFTAACVLLWFLVRYTDEAVVVTTAPTWLQVEKLLWGEVHSALLRSRIAFPKANLTELKLGPKRFAYGLSTAVTKQDEGVRFQGIHAKHLLMILDEAPGVNAKIYESVEGNRAGGDVHVLALGNPTIASGPFHDAFINNRSGWETFTIDAFETPNFKDIPGHMDLYDREGNVIPGSKLDYLLKLPDEDLDRNVCPYLVSRRWVKERFYEWGPKHPSWESRVRGAFPSQAPDSLLSLSWLEEAAIRTIEDKEDFEVSAGVDVAGPGEDETSLTVRKGPIVLLHVQTSQPDPRGWLVQHLLPYKDVIKNINVDSIGIGWNMYTHLKDIFKDVVTPINVCESANDTEKFADLKSEFFWGLRERVKDGDFAGLKDDKTIGQLAGIRYKANSRGQIEIESKEDARKRGVKSPDRAESTMLAFGGRVLIYGVLELQKKIVQQARSAQSQKEEINARVDCPICHAVCVVPNNSGWRCNQCGHQWTVKKDQVKPIGGREWLRNLRGNA